MRAALLPLILLAASSLPSVSVHAQQVASVDQLKYLQYFIGEWEAEDGQSLEWAWTLNGHFLTCDTRNADGDVTIRALAGWDENERKIVNRLFTSGGNFVTQVWSRKAEDQVVVCTANSKYYFTMRPVDKDTFVVEFANGNERSYKRKQ